MHFRLPWVIFDCRNLIETHKSVGCRRANAERAQSIERRPIAGWQKHAHVERAVALDDRRRCGTAERRLDRGCDIGGRYSEYRRALRIDAECHRGTADHNPVEDFDDAFHFADRRRDLAGGPMQGGCVFAIQPNLDRGGRALQVADQIAEDPDELYAQPRLGRFDFLPQLAGHFIAWTPALIAQLDGEVAGIWLRYAGEPELQPGAARETLDVGRLLQEAFDMTEHAIGLEERGTRRRDVVENECAFVERRQKFTAEKLVEQKGDEEQGGHYDQDPARVTERKLQ